MGEIRTFDRPQVNAGGTFDRQTVSNRTFSIGLIRYKARKFLIYIINNPSFAEHVASICLGLSKTQYPMSYLTLKMRWFTILRYKYWYASVLPPYIALPKQVEVTVIANRDVKWTAAYAYCQQLFSINCKITTECLFACRKIYAQTAFFKESLVHLSHSLAQRSLLWCKNVRFTRSTGSHNVPDVF